MGSNCIEIDTELLYSDIVQMRDSVQEAKKQTNNMFDAMKHLDTMWDGPANEQFQAQFFKDYTDMQALCGEVEHLISCMEFAKQNYEQCEEDVYDKVLSLKTEGGA